MRKNFAYVFQALAKGTLDYGRLKMALLLHYKYTGVIQLYNYTELFREANLEAYKNLDQYVVRLKNYFTQFIKLPEEENSFKGVIDWMVREQFINFCSKELSVHLMRENLRV